jgi:hypothetical protein
MLILRPMASDRDSPSPSDQVAALYEQLETQAAQASEHLVGTRGFAGLLGQLAENAAALTKLGNEAMDLALRNLRVAGRRDIARLGRQLARTEDKLERVLQEVELLRDQIAAADGRGAQRASGRGGGAQRASGAGGSQRSNGASTRRGKSAP